MRTGLVFFDARHAVHFLGNRKDDASDRVVNAQAMQRAIFLSTLGAGLLATTQSGNAAERVSVLHAGSLNTVFAQRLAPEFERLTGLHAEGEGRGSVANAKLIAAGLKTPDVFLSADTSVTRDLLKTGNGTIAWYASFATTRMVIAYSLKSPFATQFAEAARGARRWYDVLRTPGMRIGRTDPAIDPKGYRTLIVADLAERLYNIPNLRSALFGAQRNPDQTLTDEAILVRLEQGDIDVAFVYGVEATIRSLPTIELDPRINLGDPRYAARYATASETIEGVVRRGEPIEYAFTIPTRASNPSGGVAFLRYLISTDGRRALDAAGLQAQTPQFFGDLASVPEGLRSVR